MVKVWVSHRRGVGFGHSWRVKESQERGLVSSVPHRHNPRLPPGVRKTDTFIVIYLFVLHSVNHEKTYHFTACLTSLWTSFSVFCVKTARDVVTVCLYLLNIHYFTYTFSTCTYRGSHTQAHMYNQYTRGMATTRHSSLVERSGKKAFVRDKGLAHTQKGGKKCQEKPDIHESKAKDLST